MGNKLEGISAGTVEAIENALDGEVNSTAIRIMIKTLLASGEVAIVKKGGDAERLRNFLVSWFFTKDFAKEGIECNPLAHAIIDQFGPFAGGDFILRTDHEAEMQKVRESVAELVATLEEAGDDLRRAYMSSSEGCAEPEADDLTAYIREALSHFTTNHATTPDEEK